MNTKRWIALGAAALLLVISTIVNVATLAFTSNWSSGIDELFAQTEEMIAEDVIEDGDPSNRIAVLTVDGVIQDTGDATSLFSSAGYNHQFFMDQLNQIEQDDSIQGVILAVNSPGGGVVESAQIYDKLIEMKEEYNKPIYVSMGGMAASGGYYISAPADKIFVNRETLTGSIGVIMESVNYGDLAKKYGVDFVTIKTGPYKDIMSPTRDMTDAERQMLQTMINDSYESFVDVIEQGRHMTEAEVKKIADGRIMNGRQAVEVGLADDFGYLEDTIAAMKKDYDLEDAEVMQYSFEPSLTSLFGMKAQSLFGSSMETQLVGKLLTDYQSPRMMYLYGEK